MVHRERIVLLGPDGRVAIINPVEPIQPPESVEEWLDRVTARAISVNPNLTGYVRVAVLDVSRFPTTRRFRNVWSYIAGTVYVDEILARKQLLTEVRVLRDAALRESDHEKAKLDEIGTAEQRKSLAEYRQALRDIPAAVAEEIALLSTAAMEAYKPRLPEKP